MPAPPGVTAYEETDPSVSFSGIWTGDRDPLLGTGRCAWFAWSGGDALYSMTAGAQPRSPSRGTFVAWIGCVAPTVASLTCS